MTEPIPDVPTPPIDFTALQAQDVPMPDEHGAPDHKASRTPLRSRFKAAGDKPSTPKAPVKRVLNKRGQFIEPLTNLYGTMGLMLAPIDPVCAKAIMEAAPRCAETWDELAYKNDAVRRVLWSLTQTSATLAVIMAHGPILMAVVLHHVPAAQRMLGSMGQQFADTVEQNLNANGHVPPQDPTINPGQPL